MNDLPMALGIANWRPTTNLTFRRIDKASADLIYPQHAKSLNKDILRSENSPLGDIDNIFDIKPSEIRASKIRVKETYGIGDYTSHLNKEILNGLKKWIEIQTKDGSK